MIENARNPKWGNLGKTKIALEVKLVESEEWATFIASPDDCTIHGPMLYNLAVNGLFGPVAASDRERILAGEIPCPQGYAVIDGEIVNTAAIEQKAEAELNRRLAKWNSEVTKATAEINEDYAAKRKEMLAAILAVREQKNWPLKVEWPEEIAEQPALPVTGASSNLPPEFWE